MNKEEIKDIIAEITNELNYYIKDEELSFDKAVERLKESDIVSDIDPALLDKIIIAINESNIEQMFLDEKGENEGPEDSSASLGENEGIGNNQVNNTLKHFLADDDANINYNPNEKER